MDNDVSRSITPPKSSGRPGALTPLHELLVLQLRVLYRFRCTRNDEALLVGHLGVTLPALPKDSPVPNLREHRQSSVIYRTLGPPDTRSCFRAPDLHSVSGAPRQRREASPSSSAGRSVLTASCVGISDRLYSLFHQRLVCPRHASSTALRLHERQPHTTLNIAHIGPLSPQFA